MIELYDVHKSFRTPKGDKVILDGVSYRFERGRSVGLLGRNGVGKSTVLRMLAGLERPTLGKIKRTSRISWPLAFSGGMHKGMTGRENIAFCARIYDQDVDKIIDFVDDLSELGTDLDNPVHTYSSGMRARLSLALSLAIEFDVYLVDEIPGVADLRFQRKYRQALSSALNKSDVIMISHNPRSIDEYCDHCVVLHNGKFFDYGRASDAMAALMRASVG